MFIRRLTPRCDSLCMQDDIYKKMTAKGWYQTAQADQQQIAQVKQKYTLQ